jgi:hypothetical protein
MAWGKNGTPNTLGSAGDTITISDLTATTFNVFLGNSLASGLKRTDVRFNSDTGSNYATRYSINGSSDGTGINLTATYLQTQNPAVPDFTIQCVINISSEEKLIIGNAVQQGTAGAANAPVRVETVSKWANTSAQITTVTLTNPESGDFDTSSNLSALGSDLTPAAGQTVTISDGAIFHETDTNKSYVLYNGSWTEL